MIRTHETPVARQGATSDGRSRSVSTTLAVSLSANRVSPAKVSRSACPESRLSPGVERGVWRTIWLACAIVAPLVGVDGGGAVAQDRPVEERLFEVASVRPSPPGARYALRILPGGRLSVTHGTVQRLVLTAYGLHESQLVGGPEWLYSTGFTIEAMSPDGASTDRIEMMERLRRLLHDRFGLRTHTEPHETDVYVLVFARRDKRLGESIHSSTIDCEPAAAATRLALSRGEVPSGLRCGVSFSVGPRERVMRYGAMTLQQIAVGLAQLTGRMVLDETGLPGIFDVELRLNPDPLSSTSDAPSIFTATQEQLGLKLESRRARVPVMVVDHCEQPNEN